MEDLLVGDTEDCEQPDSPAELPEHPAGQCAHSQPREVRARNENVDHGSIAAVEEVFHFTGKLVEVSIALRNLEVRVNIRLVKLCLLHGIRYSRALRVT